jgi:DNA-binding LacI/PurR family transcriptional regulator
MITAARQLKYKRIIKEMYGFISRAATGDKLPSERKLARRFGCNALTVRKAIAPFAKSGKIVRRIGSGTFIKDNPSHGGNGFLPVYKKDLKKIGMLIHSESGAYALMVIKSSHETATERSVNLRFSYVKDFGEEAMREAKNMEREGCSALILPWFPVDCAGRVVEFIRRSPLPVSMPVLIPGLEKNCFEKAELFGKGTISQTEAACHYFRLLGHRKVALLGPNQPSDTIMQRRLSAYSNFIYRENMENICGLVGESLSDMDALASKWSRIKGVLAVICHDDLHAIRFMAAMRKLGLSAPANFAIIGCNNTNEARFSDPPLTSIYDDYGYSGEWLVRSALALAKGRTDQSLTGAKHHLAIRSSSGGLERTSPKILSDLKSLGVIIEYKKETQLSSMEAKAMNKVRV